MLSVDKQKIVSRVQAASDVCDVSISLISSGLVGRPIK